MSRARESDVSAEIYRLGRHAAATEPETDQYDSNELEDALLLALLTKGPCGAGRQRESIRAIMRAIMRAAMWVASGDPELMIEIVAAGAAQYARNTGTAVHFSVDYA